MMLSTIAICLICALHLCCGSNWANDYDWPVNFECPAGQAISAIYSVHNNRREDRRWAFECKSTGGQHSYCSWTSNYVNDWDEFFNYQCSNDGFICGMRSIHHNKKEDRRFMFKCCQISGKTLSECSKTYRNDFDKPFTVNVPSGFVIRSVSSTHSNKYEDRQFSWELCKL